MPDGYISRLESKEWECWKLLDWRLNSENDSRLHGQPFLFLSYTINLFQQRPLLSWENENFQSFLEVTSL